MLWLHTLGVGNGACIGLPLDHMADRRAASVLLCKALTRCHLMLPHEKLASVRSLALYCNSCKHTAQQSTGEYGP